MATSPPPLRRTQRQMPDDAARAFLEAGFCGHLATVDAGGQPYVTPLLYVVLEGEILLHNTAARGHLRGNVDAASKACFEVAEPGDVFAYGRFECDTGIAYRSVVVFGAIRVVDDRALKTRFCEALMRKYQPGELGRPRGFFPRLDNITVYALAIERMTGKACELPAAEELWPAVDRSATPNAVAPQPRRNRSHAPAPGGHDGPQDRPRRRTAGAGVRAEGRLP
ncbi:MAG: pyridoxamine 5'-phosphate oxidase family protein [Caulobacterales bacterium]